VADGNRILAKDVLHAYNKRLRFWTKVSSKFASIVNRHERGPEACSGVTGLTR
jgi:hypothetical protein